MEELSGMTTQDPSSGYVVPGTQYSTMHQTTSYAPMGHGATEMSGSWDEGPYPMYHGTNPQQPVYPPPAVPPPMGGAPPMVAPQPPPATVPEAAPPPQDTRESVATEPDLWVSNDFKMRVTFTPAKVAKGGATNYALRVPLKELIRPDWRTSDEMKMDDRTKVGQVKLGNLSSDYFDDVSGRLFIPDTRLSIAGTPDLAHCSDRLSGDVRILGSKSLVQFTISPDHTVSDKTVLLRENPREQNVSFLESIGKGHMTHSDLWREVEKKPGTLEESHDKIAHIGSAVGQYAKHLWGTQLRFQDTEHEMVKLRRDDADAIIRNLLADRYQNMTLGEVLENGYFEFYRTHSDIDQLQKSGSKFTSPWSSPGDDVLSITSHDAREIEKESRLNSPYHIRLTMTLGLMPVAPVEEGAPPV